MKLKLLRHNYLPDRTLGVLLVDDLFFCYTLELPYIDNIKNVSAIPHGLYKIEKYKSKKHGKCFILPDVINRTGILIHKGNSPEDTEGCILLGKSINDDDNLIDSKIALDSLLDLFLEMSLNSATLEVCEC